MTIKDIARECGVGVSTVSRVLNNRPDVSERVRQKVLAAVESYGYIPNNSARDLVRSHSETIGVLVRGTGNLFFSEMIRAITEELTQRGFDLALRMIDSGADEVKAGAILEREKKLKGILFLGGRFNYSPTEMALIGVPYVCCSYSNSFGTLKTGDYSSVSIDDVRTAYDAVNELIRLGHTRIAALLDSSSDCSVSELRFNGYKAALEEAGIEFRPELVCETGGFDMHHAYEGMTDLLRRGAEFTAVFAASDMMATAAIKALNDSALRVPEDCSVIGIDGLPLTEFLIPTLTSMVQPAEEMGRESVRILAGMISGELPYEHLRPQATLRTGGSVRKL